MEKKTKRRGLKIVIALLVGLVLLCLLGMGITAVINQSMPTASESSERLSDAEKARLAEFFHLRQSLG